MPSSGADRPPLPDRSRQKAVSIIPKIGSEKKREISVEKIEKPAEPRVKPKRTAPSLKKVDVQKPAQKMLKALETKALPANNKKATKVKNAAKNSSLTFALFNNHWQGYAPRNAVDMKKALQLPFTELPVLITDKDDEPAENNTS